MILTIGPGGSGLTFLNWSIVFLRGDTIYQKINGTSTNVDINPLIGSIAHNFSRDHLQTPNNLCQIELGNEKSVIYITPTHQRDFDYLKKFNCKKIVFDCENRHKELFARLVTCVPDSKFLKLINSLQLNFGADETKQTLLECSKIFTNYYTIPENSDEYFRLSYNDIFFNLDTKIASVFLFLNCEISPDRMHKWLEIYKIYKEKNSKILNDFEPPYLAVPNKIKLQIVKELIAWKNGSYPHTNNSSLISK